MHIGYIQAFYKTASCLRSIVEGSGGGQLLLFVAGFPAIADMRDSLT